MKPGVIMATQYFKRNLSLNLYREGKKILLVCFFLPLKRDKNVWHLQAIFSIWRPLAFLPVTLSFPLVVSWINKLVRLDNRIFISKKKETIMPWKSMVGDFLPWSFSGKDSVFPVQGSWVWSLVRELKSHILHGVARKKKTHGKMLYTFC